MDDFVFVPVPIANSLRAGFQVSNLVDVLQLTLSLIHVGFQTAWSFTYNDIEKVVGDALQKYDVEKVRVTGHSLGEKEKGPKKLFHRTTSSSLSLLTYFPPLTHFFQTGAAIATLDTIALKGKFPGQTFENIVFASPRIFNPAGATLYTELFSDPTSNVTHHNVVNSDDLVPHLGPLILGFEHSSGEVFLPVNGSEQAVNCPGTENINCLLGRSLNASLDYHDGECDRVDLQ